MSNGGVKKPGEGEIEEPKIGSESPSDAQLADSASPSELPAGDLSEVAPPTPEAQAEGQRDLVRQVLTLEKITEAVRLLHDLLDYMGNIEDTQKELIAMQGLAGEELDSKGEQDLLQILERNHQQVRSAFEKLKGIASAEKSSSYLAGLVTELERILSPALNSQGKLIAPSVLSSIPPELYRKLEESSAMATSLKKPEAEENKWQRSPEYPYRDREEFLAINRARRLLAMPDLKSQIDGLGLLTKCGLVASKRYDEIHTAGSREFSRKSLEEPNRYAEKFAERTNMGPDSLVLEIGCGMGADSIAFAKTGARVIALDSSAVAIERFKRSLILYQLLNDSIDQLSRTGLDENYQLEEHTGLVKLSPKGIAGMEQMLGADASQAIGIMNQLLKIKLEQLLCRRPICAKDQEQIIIRVLSEVKRLLIQYPQLAKNIMAKRGEVRNVLKSPQQLMQEVGEVFEAHPKGITHIYGFSTLHYFPPAVTKQLFAKFFEVLRKQKGYLGVAMKTINSASAAPDRHLRLTRHDGFNMSLDREVRVVRGYLEEEQINELPTGAGFKVVDMLTVPLEGYDQENETEEFRFITSKAAKRVRKKSKRSKK